jgi:Skp family chaperone for outer membrane proteins
MDKRFFEFWGNLFINAAKGQEHLEDMTKWMAQGLKGFEDFSNMFRKFYGLDNVDEGSPEYLKQWQHAAGEFQKSFKDYLGLMGVIPKEEHLKLVQKYEELKKRAADQEETINHLKTLLDQRSSSQEAVTQTFQDLMNKQADEFQKLMKNVEKFSTSAPSSKKKK